MFIIIASGYAFDMTPEQIRELIERTDKNSAPEQYESYVILMNYKPGDKKTEQKAHIYRKEDKVLVIMLSPPLEKGQAFIRNEDDMWMYLPKSKKVMRIGAKENSMGGEMSNTDIMRVDLAEDYNGIYLGEEVVEGVLCYKLELKAKDRTIAYDKVIYWISKDKELPVKREYYSLSGRLLKSMYFRDLKYFAGQEIPSYILIINERNNGYSTEMIIEELYPQNNIQDHIFTPSYVKRGIIK